MGMNPNPGKLLRSQPRIDTFVEVIGHSGVIELDADPRATLTDQSQVFDE